MRRRHCLLVVGLLLWGSGCGETSPSTNPPTTDPPITNPPTADLSTTLAPGTSASGTDADADETSVDPEASGGITLTPVSADDGRPTLAWSTVPDAVDYQVVVRDPDGAPYWSWIGETTSIRFGGGELSASQPGPRVSPGSTWSVVAWADDGSVAAVSELSRVE